MKRWNLVVVAMVSAFALIATPALAATQSQQRLQDGVCTECPDEAVQLRLRSYEASQTQSGEMVQAQTKYQAGEMVRVQNGEMTQTQAKTQTGEMTQAQSPEWAEKLARHQHKRAYKYAKCVQTEASSD